MERIKSLDGIRAVAVFLVLLFHVGLFPAGWVGVQVFFVLSGYLISDILLRERERPFPEYLVRFYWRRSLRILPLYLFFLSAVALAYLSNGSPKSLPDDSPYLLTYTVNFARLRAVDVGSTFVHLWSLAVEEQFYLLWPIVVYFLQPSAFRRTVLTIIAGTPLIRLTLYFILRSSSHDVDWIGRNIYCLPISQFDAFATGAAVVLWKPLLLRWAERGLMVTIIVAAICGVSVLLHDYLLYKNVYKESLGYQMYLVSDWGFVWAYSLINIASAFLILCAIKRAKGLRFLESETLVWFGSISYGVYVYHVPLLRAMELPLESWSRPATLFIYFVAVVVVSQISYVWVETPFLRLKDGRKVRRLFGSRRLKIDESGDLQ